LHATIDTTPTLTPNSCPTNAIINTPQQENATTERIWAISKTTQGRTQNTRRSPGNGVEAKSGDTVTVNYLGTLKTTKFDSSYDRNTPFTTQIGVGQVIKGWDEGIVGMKVGGKES